MKRMITERALRGVEAELRRYGTAGRVRGDGAVLAEERPERVLLAVLCVGTLHADARDQVQLVPAITLFCWGENNAVKISFTFMVAMWRRWWNRSMFILILYRTMGQHWSFVGANTLRGLYTCIDTCVQILTNVYRYLCTYTYWRVQILVYRYSLTHWDMLWDAG